MKNYNIDIRGKKALEILKEKNINVLELFNIEKIDGRSICIKLSLKSVFITYKEETRIINIFTKKEYTLYNYKNKNDIKIISNDKKILFKEYLKLLNYKYSTFEQLLTTYKTFKNIFKYNIVMFDISSNQYFYGDSIHLLDISKDELLKELEIKNFNNSYIYEKKNFISGEKRLKKIMY